MENLKDKLNSIPQDFDREKLWSKIQDKKKKKKRFLWFWLLPIVAAFYFLMPTWDLSLKEPLNKSLATASQISEVVLNNQENKENTNEEVSVLSNSIPETSKTNDKIKKNTIESAYVKSKQNQINYQSNNSDIHKKKNLISSNNYGYNYKNENSFASKDIQSQNAINNITLTSMTKLTLDENLSRDIIGVASIRKLTLWQMTINSIFKDDHLETREIQPYLKQRADYDLPFYFRFGVGVGKDIHNYKDADRKNEKELESLTASIELEQFLTKKFSVSGALSYTRNTTNLRFEEEQSNIGFADGTLVNDRYITTYNLYNNYTRFDAALNLKYFMEVKQLVLSPSVGFGYNISSKVDGEILVDDRQLSPLASLGYKQSSGIFGELKMDIGYELDNNLIIGLSGNIQTKRYLDIEEIHSIQPFQLSIFAKKTIF
jgi:hypothetical protein